MKILIYHIKFEKWEKMINLFLLVYIFLRYNWIESILVKSTFFIGVK